MNINLKQPEIEVALRQYIGSKLDLRNSTLAIVFNMGRGDNGLSANLTIDDILIPGFTDDVGSDDDTFKAGSGIAQLALQAGPSDAFNALVGAASAKAADPEILLGGGEIGSAVKAVVEVTAKAATLVVEDPAEVEISGTDVLTGAEAVKAEPIAEAKTAEAPVQVRPTTSLFG